MGQGHIVILALYMSICLSMYFICANLKGGLYVNIKLHFFLVGVNIILLEDSWTIEYNVNALRIIFKGFTIHDYHILLQIIVLSPV